MTWNVLKLGNGGIITGIDIANDGTMVCRTDSFGAYVWNTSQNQWVQILNTAIMPGSVNFWNGGGCDEIRIERGNSNNIWMLWANGLYKSTDKATTFSLVSTFPAIYVNSSAGSPTKAWGPYIAIDPNNSSVVYVSTTSRGLYVTVDGGTSWTAVTAVTAGLIGFISNTPSPPTSGTDSTSVTVGTGSKTFSNNSASFGLPVGVGNFVQVYRTTDKTVQMIGAVTASSGTSFTINVDTIQGSGTFSNWTVSSLTQAAFNIGGGHRICFDTSNGTTGGKTSNIFVFTYGIGLYKSTDAGSTWSLQNSTGMPTGMRRMVVDPFGVLWCVDDMYGAGTNIDKYDTTTWSLNQNPVANRWYTSIAVDPTHVSSKGTVRICVICGDRENIALSNDGGATYNNSGDTGNRTFVSSGDVDWLVTYYQATDGFFANCDCNFDPITSGKLWTGAEGVWWLTPPSSGVAITLTQQSRGIEQFIGNNIMSMPGDSGGVLMGTWDFPVFYSNSLNSYPNTIGGVIGPNQTALLRGYSFDYDWNNPANVVGIIQSGDGVADGSSKSNNYGKPGSWSSLTMPAGISKQGAQIASAGSGVYVIMQTANFSLPQETTNGGTTWNTISISGGTPSQFWGAIQSSATYCKAIESDKANGDIYIYNVNDGAGNSPIFKRTQSTGVWSTANANANFTGESNFNEQLTSTGVAGHMFFTGGFGAYTAGLQPDTNKLLYFTNNGWTTKNTVPNFVEVHSIGVGATITGQSYPCIYAVGWYNSVFGVWQCPNWNPSNTATGTWTRLGNVPLPTGSLQIASRIDGDKTLQNVVYLISTAAGSFYWAPDTTTSAYGFSVITDSGQRRTRMIGY